LHPLQILAVGKTGAEAEAIMSLKYEYFAGTVLKDPDPKNRGRYKVNIPELQLRMPNTSGIWCRNRVHSYKVTSSKDGVYGSYTPLHPNTHVIVSVANNDYTSASIERINVPDSVLDRDTLPFDITDDCRDDMYMLLRTAKYDSIIAVVEDVPLADSPPDVRTEPDNSLHIYHHNGDTKIILNSDGVHIHTAHNLAITVDKNSNISINGNSSISVAGNCGVSVGGSSSISVGGNCDVSAGGVTNILGGGDINIDAPNINLNSGAAAPAAPAANAGYETYPSAGKELRLRTENSKL